MPVSDKQLMAAIDRRLETLEGRCEAFNMRIIDLEKRMAQTEGRMATTIAPIPPHMISVTGNCGHTYSTGSTLEPGGLEEVAWVEMAGRSLCPSCVTKAEQEERKEAGKRLAEGRAEAGALTTRG